MPEMRTIIRVILVLFTASLIGFVALHKYMYPFGKRAYTLRQMHAVLALYADENFGMFPGSEKGAYEALSKLYPKFCTGAELAGVSGDIRAVEAALLRKEPLNGSLTSWCYVPGLRRGDNPEIAVLWEARGGLLANGRRNFFGGHAVLLLSGAVTNVPASAWTAFLNEQQKLRYSIQRREESAKERQH
jgi:hypothetical protein